LRSTYNRPSARPLCQSLSGTLQKKQGSTEGFQLNFQGHLAKHQFASEQSLKPIPSPQLTSGSQTKGKEDFISAKGKVSNQNSQPPNLWGARHSAKPKKVPPVYGTLNSAGRGDKSILLPATKAYGHHPPVRLTKTLFLCPDRSSFAIPAPAWWKHYVTLVRIPLLADQGPLLAEATSGMYLYNIPTSKLRDGAPN